MNTKIDKVNLAILISLGVIVIIAGVLFYFNYDRSQPQPEQPQQEEEEPVTEIDTSNWETYTNQEYGFSIQHPADWEVAQTTNDPIADKFNIYKPTGEEPETPYTHHSSGVSHVSVFPEGIPTEGFFGEQVPSEVMFNVNVTQPRDYILSDDTRFATYANLTSPHDNWNDSGFIFSYTEVENLETDCVRDGQEVPQEDCDVLSDDKIVRHGSINAEDRAIQVAMMESFTFTERVVDELTTEYKDLIRIDSPEPGATVSSPLTITGEARGNWYFEANFTVYIEDADGNVLGTHFATAQDEWTTSEYVPYEAELEFDEPTTETGTLVLEKANPSGLPENADEFRVPVQFNLDEDQEERSVLLYYYNAELDEDEDGNIMCSDQGLVAVERQIPVSQTPIQDTINLLLSGDITDEEEAEGITTEYPLEGLELEGVSRDNGTLTLEFSDPNNATSGGSCRAGILWMQIRETVEQFEGVEEVMFEPEFLFQP